MLEERLSSRQASHPLRFGSIRSRITKIGLCRLANSKLETGVGWNRNETLSLDVEGHEGGGILVVLNNEDRAGVCPLIHRLSSFVPSGATRDFGLARSFPVLGAPWDETETHGFLTVVYCLGYFERRKGFRKQFGRRLEGLETQCPAREREAVGEG